MDNHVNPLVLTKVIGDVIDMFVPLVNFSVHFGAKHVNNGCDIKPSIAMYPPKVQISGCHNDLFTLVMVDPDAPSPSEPSMREWVHWVVVDIPGGTNPLKGLELVPYMGPCPPVGIHRYALVLFQQKTPFLPVTPLFCRAHFNTREFAIRHNLGLPVAAVFFNSQKEPLGRRR